MNVAAPNGVATVIEEAVVALAIAQLAWGQVQVANDNKECAVTQRPPNSAD